MSRPELAEIGSAREKDELREAGCLFRDAGIARIWLVHGTFVGQDALGWARRLRLLSSTIGTKLERWQRHWLAAKIGDAGNFTDEYAGALEKALNDGGQTRIDVGLVDWSSENHHLARADGAVRILDRLSRLPDDSTHRVLVWSHSHGGNVMALVTNLLACDASTRRAFFGACRWYYRDPLTGRINVPMWRHVERWLESDEHPRRRPSVTLDIATMGTPIRYGWDANGYDHLLHYVNHRALSSGDLSSGKPPYLASMPREWNDVFQAMGGDYIQQFGIAGTNFRPTILSWRTLMANWRLQSIVQRDVSSRHVVANWRKGMRVPDEGTCLLVDYGDQRLPFAEQIAGHAVYTRRAWMSFHALDIARRCSAISPAQPHGS